MKVHLVEPHIVPKLKLSANVPLPDDFRREFDAWLLEQFGTIDLTAQRRGQVFISDVFGLMVVRRDDYAAFIHHC